MKSRPKQSICEQIATMKSNGVKFDLITENEAARYLEYNTYFFKVKAYDILFEKYQTGEKKGQYLNLDFAYLKELSIIDMHLRHFLLNTCVDVEHAIKVTLMRDFNNSSSDGYDIVDKYFTAYPDVREELMKKKGNSYSSDLITKLETEGYALWNIIEVISFGNFIQLYDMFYQTYPECQTGINYTYPMRNIKNLRNAAAHNNCIIDQLCKELSDNRKENRKITSYVVKIPGITRDMRRTMMKHRVIHDFATLLYIIDTAIDSPGIKSHLIESLDQLVNERMIRHKDYFTKNNTLMASYHFIKLMVDNMKKTR